MVSWSALCSHHRPHVSHGPLRGTEDIGLTERMVVVTRYFSSLFPFRCLGAEMPLTALVYLMGH